MLDVALGIAVLSSPPCSLPILVTVGVGKALVAQLLRLKAESKAAESLDMDNFQGRRGRGGGGGGALAPEEDGVVMMYDEAPPLFMFSSSFFFPLLPKSTLVPVSLLARAAR